MQRSALFILLTILSLCVIALFVIVLLPKKAFEAKDALPEVAATLAEPTVTFIDPIRGDINAGVTIIEYGDYLCPLCQNIEPDLQRVVAAAPRKRRIVWKDAPNNDAHEAAVTVAMAARCAQDQGAFWMYHDRLMEARGSITTAEQLQTLSQTLELNTTAFASCMAASVTRPVVLHTLQEAMALKASGTPTLYINGKLYSGALSAEAIETYLSTL
ncbi:MAG: DsbA family protein [Candidatus Harrisonbacteria bacterium]|nr:DsbA family protein [Candidatus Harrisonbacteria bacterium]